MSWLETLRIVRYAFTFEKERSTWLRSVRKTVRRGFNQVVREGRQYRLVLDGMEGPFKPVPKLKARVKELLVDRPGMTIVLEAWDGGFVVGRVRFHRSVKEKTIPDIGAAPGINRIHYAVWITFGSDDVRSGGRWYCRYISGSRLVSRHGYRGSSWLGAAEDIFVEDPNTMAHLYEVGSFIVRETIAGRLAADRVIVGDLQWTKDRGWHSYDGTFHTHVHVEVWAGSACSP